MAAKTNVPYTTVRQVTMYVVCWAEGGETRKRTIKSRPAAERWRDKHAQQGEISEKKGNWEATIRRPGDAPKYVSAPTKAALEKRARDYIEQREKIGEHDPNAARRTFVSDIMGDYSREVAPGHKASKQEKSRVNMLKEWWGKKSFAAVTADSIVEYASERASNVSSDTIRRELTTLRLVLDYAKTEKKIPVRPEIVSEAKRRLKKTKKLKPGQQRERRITNIELVKIIAETNSEYLPYFLVLGLETTMRRSEVAAFSMADVRIGQQPHTILREHKTDDSGKDIVESRTVLLSPTAVAAVRDLMAILETKETEIENQRDHVLFPVSPDSMSKAFSRACKRTKIEDCHLHDLRHESICRLFERGLSIEQVAEHFTGHKDWRTLKRYTHLRPTSTLWEMLGRHPEIHNPDATAQLLTEESPDLAGL
jgi:integrase